MTQACFSWPSTHHDPSFPGFQGFRRFPGFQGFQRFPSFQGVRRFPRRLVSGRQVWSVGVGATQCTPSGSQNIFLPHLRCGWLGAYCCCACCCTFRFKAKFQRWWFNKLLQPVCTGCLLSKFLCVFCFCQRSCDLTRTLTRKWWRGEGCVLPSTTNLTTTFATTTTVTDDLLGTSSTG